MNRTIYRAKVLLALTLALLVPMKALALQDIDLYGGNPGSSAPNVLFYLDNSSNWSAASNAWSYSTVYGKCTTNYSDPVKQAICQGNVNLVFCPASNGAACAGNPSLVQGQVEIRALQLVLKSTACTSARTPLAFNVGLMMGAQSTYAGSIADGSSVGTSYIRHAIRPIGDGKNCLTSAPSGTDATTGLTQYLLADLSNIDSKVQATDFKTSSSFEYGAGLYEAFKYFGGWTNPAHAPGTVLGGATGIAGNVFSTFDASHFGPGRYSVPGSPFEDPNATTNGGLTYRTPIDQYGSCGKNFIILIGNSFPAQEFGTDQNPTPPTNLLMTRVGYSPSQLYSVSNKSTIRFADEWAQFLYTTSIAGPGAKQNVSLFTIDVFNKQQDTNQSALLQSMAMAGQGTDDYKKGYFAVGGDLQALVDALTNVLTQIAAVNSVFASAALPVSVNAQGTYLNQIFVGVFRPDSNEQQRWYGNLKQYKFGLTSSNTLYLADANGASAVDAASTGFLQNCALSFWTTDTGTYWQDITGTASACATQTTSTYSDAPDGPLVERGGAAQKLRALGYANRNLRTCPAGGCSTNLVDFNTSNVTSVSGVTDTSTFVNWVRGQNTGDGITTAGGTSYTQYTYTAPGDGSTPLTGTSTRPTIHGEVVHSTPLAINYGSGGVNDVVVFYGAGDGVLHAIDGNQTGSTAGQELWGFIAPEHWSSLNRVRTNSPLISYPNVSTSITPTPTPKTYFFDGPITGYQDADPLTKLWMYAGMRRGGNMIYAFDASSKPSLTRQPTLLWKFGCATAGTRCASSDADEAKMGQSWSAATVIRVKGINEPLVVFGGGYDNCEDDEVPNTACASLPYGKGIYVMSAQAGRARNYRYISPAGGTYATSTGSVNVTPGRFVASMAAIDVDGDGYVDVLYAVDTRGNIWRINTSNPSAGYAGYANGVADWPAPQLVANVSQWGTSSLTERRKFMYAPNVIMVSRTQALILVGTGDREKPSSASNAAQVVNRFYGIKDSFQTTSGVTPVIGYGLVPVGTNLTDLLNVTGQSTINTATLAVYRGWFMDLYTTSAPFEQVVTSPLTIGGVTYFNTYQAKPSSSSDNTCSNLGTARGYQIDFLTGVEKLNANNDLAPVTYLSQGIPTTPVGGKATVNGTDVTFCISCASNTNNSVLDPKKVTISPNPTRTPVYRYQRIDGK